MAMSLYACTFKWVIGKINQRIKSSESYSTIGVLDIFGFENFDVSYVAPNLRFCPLSFCLGQCVLVLSVPAMLVNVSVTLYKFVCFFARCMYY